MRSFTRPAILFGAIGLACIACLFGGFYFFGRSGSESSAATAGAKPAHQAAKTAASGDEPVIPSDTARGQTVALLGDARRMADDGKFDEAQAKLAEADKLTPGLAEIAETRRKIADMAKPESQFVTQIERTKSAVDNGNWAAAEQALTAAERLKPQAPEIAELRQRVAAGKEKGADRHQHVEQLLTRMREAIARGDIAAADAALNAAARLDISDPTVDEARVELARALDGARGARSGR